MQFLRQKNINLQKDQPRVLQIKYDIQRNLYKTLQSAIITLCTEHQELAPVLQPVFKDRGIPFPEREPSIIDIASSVKSGASSQKSSASRGRRQ
mmetsp:Transcript_2806/g.2442  ORF Transcript_2806/g.2442 Transcript_2806/m.2442 type:complete len:94 (+) Transcript_2806:2612-2893(+)